MNCGVPGLIFKLNIFGKYEYPKPTTEANKISELIKKTCTDFGLNVDRRIKKIIP